MLNTGPGDGSHRQKTEIVEGRGRQDPWKQKGVRSSESELENSSTHHPTLPPVVEFGPFISTFSAAENHTKIGNIKPMKFVSFDQLS